MYSQPPQAVVALDPRTGKSRILLKEARIGDLVFNRADRSLWGVRHFNGLASLVRIPHPYKEWRLVRSWPFGETVYDLDISPDGALLSASVGEVTGRHSLQVMRTAALLEGDATPVAATDFGAAIPMNFVFDAEGKALYEAIEAARPGYERWTEPFWSPPSKVPAISFV